MELGDYDLEVWSERIVTPNGEQRGTLCVRDGRIADITDRHLPGAIDASGRVVLPGLVDSHVHVNEPGRTHWEGFETATRAAASGGVTTIVDMPLNSIPPTVRSEALEEKLAAARDRVHVDVAFWGGVIPGNAMHLPGLHARGVPGFKCFLVPSGVDEFPHVLESDLKVALPVIRDLGGVLLVHAELPGPIDAAELRPSMEGPCCYRRYLTSRPPAAEVQAVELLIRLARETGARIHIVHLACGDAIELLARAREEGLSISAETCPHYLSFDAARIPDRATAYKCAPPIREAVHREALWDGLKDGIVSMVVTDHSPCPPELKRLDEGDFMAAWGGIASLQISLPVVWTQASARRVTLPELAAWMASAPAKLAGLADRKGSLVIGADADFVIFDPDREVLVAAADLEHRHAITPYDGATLRGVVEATYLRGQRIYHAGQLIDVPHGTLLTR